MGTLRSSIALFTVVLAFSASTQAGLVFTFEAAGVQSTSVPGVTTETFNSGAPSAVIGTYANATVSAADVFGGAFGTDYLDITGTQVTTLTLNSPQKYFGMWWSAGDANDLLTLYDGAVVLDSLTVGADLIPVLAPAYYGNPNGGGNESEPYAYLNFTATGSSNITRIEFTQTTSSGGFETDNHSVTDEPIDPPGRPLIPEPTTFMVWSVLGLIGVSCGQRRRP